MFARSLAQPCTRPPHCHSSRYRCSRDIPDRKIKHSPMHRSVDRRSCISSTQTHEAVPHIPNECTDGGYRSGSENHKCSLGSACMRLLSSYKMYTIHSHTRTHTMPARTHASTHMHAHVHTYIHIWAHVKTMSLGSYYLHPRTKAHNRMTK